MIRTFPGLLPEAARQRRMRRWGLAALLSLAACGGSGPPSAPPPTPTPQQSLLIAPLIEGQSYCEEAVTSATVTSEDEAAALCTSLGKTGAPRVRALLDALGPERSPTGRYRLGFTVNLPVFRFYRKSADGWVFDDEYLAKYLRLISEVDRPVVVFLSSDHFAVTNDELTAELVRDQRNLMYSREGPLQPTSYFRNPIVAWTLADQRAAVDVLRYRAFEAVRDGLCRLPEAARRRIEAVSVLGETHKMFPNLEAGPRYDVPMYMAGDYSPVAVGGFRVWLAQKFGTIDRLNRELDATFTSFDEISPPSRDINRETLPNGFFDHIDASAAGSMAVYGWIFDRRKRPLRTLVYLDGVLITEARKGLNRTDATAAFPGIEDPNVGFHFDLNIRQLDYGFHRLDVVVDTGDAKPVLFASRRFLVGDRRQSVTTEHPYAPIDVRPLSAEPDLVGGLDAPLPLTAVYYNPLAELWLQFRNQVVRNYVTRYAELMVPSCLTRSQIFSHQLAPTLYGGWNADLLAADTTQLPSPAFVQGTTLYGGTAFGTAFLEMKRQLGWDRYSVGEMHPIVPLTPNQYFSMFEMHRTNGAVFVAPYYMSTVRDEFTTGNLSGFLISPKNRENASDLYYRAIQDVMRQ